MTKEEQIADLKRQIKELEAGPDYEQYRDVLNAFYISAGYGSNFASNPLDDFDIDNIKGLIAAMPLMPKQADDDGWIEWHGGDEPPVEGRVDFKFKNGDIELNIKPVDFIWSHDCGEYNIVAYRVAGGGE